MASEHQGDENTSSGNMENVMDEEGLQEGVGRKFNESINGEEVMTDKKLDVNNADKEDLMRVPGVKEEIAERIINSRNEIGGFKNFDDLEKIGLAPEILEMLKKFLKVG